MLGPEVDIVLLQNVRTYLSVDTALTTYKALKALEALNPLTPRKYTVLKGNFVFDLCDFLRNITLA